ncbi:MAG: 50S ribosomal protein L18 [Gammaproteobacteria bacterium]|nr:50S ribosomal protein L18 [Gammaproteobacteria bacterium]
MIKIYDSNAQRLKRHARVRQTVSGTEARPRLNVFRSNTNIYAQVIDDTKGVTLVSASSLKLKNGSNIEGAKAVGKAVAEAALKAGITEVVFDRGGYIYHGRVKALAEAAREAGLKF